ncbi:class III poly(R)-hydroxyalkanoic acid synthase subunit PhaE [Lysobacter auxotrophicus]|uniref:Poly(3-hydroxyalkanoate) polymerase subunit PhaE n=1 Tax=Lysobacter auxotrophicus TaxID=2992573 RepID=A0ABN6UIT3_9GAMM|nr:class III poly(R)-hydroxyalkanoic acid synthase subunit PhaE [Lysobacter auxotrophicus]BDU16203.1 class III poly(R)-hydroxyalkanoic acid synthase subunit PhaE [Lysobacter auxotrophicus]
MAMQGVDEFEAWNRRYWNAWGDALRATQPSATPAMPGWNEAVDWWSQFARGGLTQGDEAVTRFNAQAQGWFGQMQQLAAQFAGRPANAADIASAWKQALGGDGANPFAQVFANMPGSAQTDPSKLFETFAPWLQSMQQGGRSWLSLPAFGFAREHQERWQQLAQAQLDLQQQSQAYQALLAEAGQDAFARFERKLEERSAPGKQLDSVRALFDVWIDAAEEAYADIALSPRFRDAYAALVNAQMTLRGRMQKEVEQIGSQFGMPTRTEVDSAHRKIVELEREQRRLRDAIDALTRQSSRTPQREEPAQASPPPSTPKKAASKATKAAKQAAPASKNKTGRTR